MTTHFITTGTLLAVLVGFTSPAPGAESMWQLRGSSFDENQFSISTPYYAITLERDPARISSVAIDPWGKGNLNQCIIRQVPDNDRWTTTLFVGIGGFTNTRAGAADELVVDQDGLEVLLRDVYLTEELSADWEFRFENDRFTHKITWKASAPIANIVDLGHQWVSVLGFGGDDQAESQTGDVNGFGEYSQVYDLARTFRMSFKPDSTTLTANRYFHGAGIVWQSMFPSSGGILSAGTHAGGEWECRPLPTSEAGITANQNQIGLFEHPGKYLKDFFFLKNEGVFHLFYNIGEAGATQDWQDEGNEKMFGHATSSDLRNWEILDPILPVIPNSWEGQVVSAPSIVKVSDEWRMIYTGFDDRYFGNQSVGLATSTNLVDWHRYPGNPVYIAPDWTDWTPTAWANCRDPHVIASRGFFYMYTMVTDAEHRGAISIARSEDMREWTDLGAAVVPGGQPESPVTFERNGQYYLITTAGEKACYQSDDPEANGWTEIPFEFPAPGFWSAFEILEDGDRWIAAAFVWKNYGNFIMFWELEWDGDRPWVRY